MIKSNLIKRFGSDNNYNHEDWKMYNIINNNSGNPNHYKNINHYPYRFF